MVGSLVILLFGTTPATVMSVSGALKVKLEDSAVEKMKTKEQFKALLLKPGDICPTDQHFLANHLGLNKDTKLEILHQKLSEKEFMNELGVDGIFALIQSYIGSSFKCQALAGPFSLEIELKSQNTDLKELMKLAVAYF